MFTRRGMILSTGGLLALGRPAAAQSSVTIPSDADVELTLKAFVDVWRRAPGVIVGIVDANGSRILAHGARAAGDRRPLSGDTVFEIGSVTKLFTALTLADMVRTGDARFDDPVERLLPHGFPVPSFQQRPIKLVDLATHSSGLPALPSNMMFRDFANPYPYSKGDLMRCLAALKLAREPGLKWEYSNVGAALLADALAAGSDQEFEALLKARIFTPLSMRRTGITLTSDQRQDLATGHDSYLHPVGLTEMPGLAGAGMVKSTTSDLLAFVQASMLDIAGSVRADTISMLEGPGIPIASKYEQAVGWMVHQSDPGPTFWHDGGSAGCCSFVGFNAQTRRVVVVLSNAACNAGIGDLGHHLLSGAPLSPTSIPAEPSLIDVRTSEAELCLGRYRFSSDGSYVTVSRRGRHVFFQADDKPGYEIYTTAPREFFMKAYRLKMRFRGPATTPAEGLDVIQGTATDTALRV